MLVLSGGTGTVKLLRGLQRKGADFEVAVNTAEDIWMSGNLVCPDLDSVIYGLAGCLGEGEWGIEGDTFNTHERLRELGSSEYMRIGDRDRALHIARTELIGRGLSLSEATSKLAGSFDIEIGVYPMTDDWVDSYVVTPEGPMHFQEFWVKEGGEPEVEAVYFEGLDRAEPSPPLESALERRGVVLIGPSNPVTSIGPILGLEGVERAISGKRVVAVSPVVGDAPISGPAGKLLEAEGFEATTRGVEKFYGDLVDILVRDEREVTGRHSLDTIMEDGEGEERLASELLGLLEAEGWH